MLSPNYTLVQEKRLAKMAKMGVLQTFTKNETVITEGDPASSLFFLISGQLKVFTRNRGGREVVYNILEPGEVFGEMLLDGGTRSASVKATAPSQCLVLDQAQIQGLIRKHRDFAECLIEILIGRLRNATHTIKSLVLSDVFGRTTALLNQISVFEGKIRVVPASLTQQEIADRVGATREMVNHVIKDLTDAGHITRDERRRLVFSKELPSFLKRPRSR